MGKYKKFKIKRILELYKCMHIREIYVCVWESRESRESIHMRRIRLPPTRKANVLWSFLPLPFASTLILIYFIFIYAHRFKCPFPCAALCLCVIK